MAVKPRADHAVPCVILIMHADAGAAVLSPLRCGDWPGYQFCAASTRAELTTVLATLPVQVAVACGASRTVGRLAAHLRATAPDVALLRVGAASDDGDGVLPSLTPIAALFQAIDLAARLTATRRQATVAADMQCAIKTFSDAMLGLHDRDRIAELLLETARTLLRGVIPAAVEGAVLTAGDGPQFIVRAATPAYADFLARPLPYAPQATINQMVQHQGMLAIDDRLLIPLCWFGGINGVLMLQASGLSAELPESLRILVNQASAALESSLLFELAAIDTTTRAFTRAFAIQRLHEALKSAYRSGLDLTVLMLDLDKFKLVNDTYGHLVGDRVLHAAGQLLHAALRESDVLGRYGGDEFLIILPNTPIGGGVEVTRRLLQSVQEFRLDLDGASLALSISIGIGGISQDDQISTTVIRPSHEFFHRAMERLIAQADGLMYRAKHGSTTHYAAGLPMSWNGLLAGEGLLAV